MTGPAARLTTRNGKEGSLTVVGSGIMFQAHMTLASKAVIEQAEKVWFAAADAFTAGWLVELNPSAQAFPFYQQGEPLRDTYTKWVALMLETVSQGLAVCAVFYGHPGFFAWAAHHAVERAQQLGFEACMLAGISSQACLFADLGLDPASDGYQCFDATDFLLRKRNFHTGSNLVLFQIGRVGIRGHCRQPHIPGLKILAVTLAAAYGLGHEVVIYEAAHLPIARPLIETVTLENLHQATVSMRSTLFVPIRAETPIDPEMARRLGWKIL